jgi:serine acetyltransferase
MTHDLAHLRECWQVELTSGRKPSHYRVIKSFIKTRSLQKKFLFRWRLANEMFLYGNKKQKKIAEKMQSKLIGEFSIDIALGAKIGKNLLLAHPYSITINKKSVIGENFTILQNVTIGQAHKDREINITIGNNVFIGAGSVILGGVIKIGDNVNIGAMTFVNKNIPDNSTVYTQKTNTIIQND